MNALKNAPIDFSSLLRHNSNGVSNVPHHTPNGVSKLLNLGDVPLKKLKPEMFHRGRHSKTWEEKLRELKFHNNNNNNNDNVKWDGFTTWNKNNNFENNNFWQSTSE